MEDVTIKLKRETVDDIFSLLKEAKKLRKVDEHERQKWKIDYSCKSLDLILDIFKQICLQYPELLIKMDWPEDDIDEEYEQERRKILSEELP